ncbi:hypothetical protein GCM10010156_56980 [Planobispora rosea]|uniref:Secreted protein n=1 Tax=Planobispora rosea TaxID=35762 RepID=A0A8J3S512_PLARO|nr:hypothetical protein [Planobispora rosea]GGS91284.1 hypothetical protein GCM10010156_56980 [Planobispora rosea]GIH86924.1 hypothetical protein Pro02_53320 [Planobispora rosea]
MIINGIAVGTLLLAVGTAPVTAGVVPAAETGRATGAVGEPPSGEGFQDGRTAGVRLRNSQIVLSGNGLGGRSDGYRLKRPCWYEPYKNADDMLKIQERDKDWWFRTSPDDSEEEQQRFLEQFKDKIGKDGRWWTSAYNEADPNGISCRRNLAPFVWVPPGTTPPGGITLAELVEIARAALTVPEPRVKLSPDATSYVNLPTWVWLDGVGETTRSVTATIPGVMSATVTAALSDIEIDPGTTADRAEVREDCGRGGRPYTKGAEFTCGVRYLRASADQPREVYELTVTAVWPVEVEDDVVPFAYDPVEVGATRDVPVGEVQSTVRKGG